MSIRRQYRIVVGVALAAAVGACGDLARTNPLDPAFDISVAISGPTTINSLGATVTYEAVTEPAWDSRAPEWTSSNPAVLRHDGSNRFTSMRVGTSTVIVRLGPHEARMDVTVSQVPASLDLQTCGGLATEFTALQQQRDLCSTIRDSAGTLMAQQGLTYSSSNQSVVGIESGRAVARATGSAWVYATYGTLRDSLPFTVTQVMTSIVIVSSGPPTLVGPDGTLQLAVLASDANGFTIPGVTGTWSSDAPDVIDVNQAGLVSAKGWGRATITVRVGALVSTLDLRTTGGTPPEVPDFFVGFAGDEQVSGVYYWVILAEVFDAQPDPTQFVARLYATRPEGTLGPFVRARPLDNRRVRQPVLISVGYSATATLLTAEAWATDIAGNEGAHATASGAVGATATAPIATSVTATRVSADSVQVDFQATDAQLDARDAWLVVTGPDVAEPVVRHALPVQTAPSFSGSIRVHLPAGGTARIELLLRDAAGGLSPFYVRAP